MNSTLQTWGEWSPTQFDARGMGAGDRRDWLVCPVIQTRDSGPLEASNFRVFEREVERIDPDGDDWESICQGHWGPGWLEIIVCRPGSRVAAYADECREALEGYPILDETDYSELEWERASEYWQSMTVRDRLEWITGRYGRGASIFAARRDEIPETETGELLSMLAE